MVFHVKGFKTFVPNCTPPHHRVVLFISIWMMLGGTVGDTWLQSLWFIFLSRSMVGVVLLC